MRLILVPISAVVLFFPAFWLFSLAVGTDWGAGIAAFLMYIWYPFFALKYLGRNHVKDPDDMSTALSKGLLEVSEYEVSDYIEVKESEDEGLYFLLSITPNETLCLCGQYLYEAVDNGNFPSSKIRIFWNRGKNYTFGVESLGDKLLPINVIPAFTDSKLASSLLPADREVIKTTPSEVVNKIKSIT